MPLRQTIGISLALLMASTGAMAETSDKSTAHHPSAQHKPEPAKSANRKGKLRSVRKAAHFHWPARVAFHRGERMRDRQLSAEAAGAMPDWGPMHTIGYQEFGQAAWYGLVGSRTSNGERLDTETPTAAHRSLPLGSCAKVTSLDTGRSVIVKINDRGPYSRRFIIDLSPRAAREIGMMQAGVAAVAVEPVAPGSPPAAATSPTAAYRNAANN